jgi:hypothetical protein
MEQKNDMIERLIMRKANLNALMGRQLGTALQSNRCLTQIDLASNRYAFCCSRRDAETKQSVFQHLVGVF